MLVASVAFAVAGAPRGSRLREPDAGHCNDGGAPPARAHQRHIPNAVHFQDGAQLVQQERDVVAGPLFAELAKLRNVFADLRCRNPHALPQFLGGCRLDAFV